MELSSIYSGRQYLQFVYLIKTYKLFHSLNEKFYIYSSTNERYYVQELNNMKDDQDHFEVLRKIKTKPESTQRELAEELGFSLGKLNYCLKALKKKGFVKIPKISIGTIIGIKARGVGGLKICFQ